MERKKIGRPLGSGVKNYKIFGCRFTKDEYELILKHLEILKKKHKRNSNVLIYLLKTYGKKIEKKEKIYKVLGYDFTKKEYNLITRNMKTIKKEYPQGKELLLYLFSKYDINKKGLNKNEL